MIVNTGERLSEEYLTHLKEAVNAPENPVKYLSIDPGTNNGICGYDEKFYLQFMLTIKADDIVKFIHQFKFVDTCIIESYALFPNKARQQIYSDMETPRVIGRVESWAEMNLIELVKQPPTIKATAYKWIGEKPLPKSNKANHSKDAHVHFQYWAIRKGHISAESVFKKNGGLQ